MGTTGRKYTLTSSDKERFEVEESVAMMSLAIKHMFEDADSDISITLPNVTATILAKVIEYCKKHAESPKTDDSVTVDDLKAWDKDFMNVNLETIFDLILAANYLNIKGLLDLSSRIVADMIKGKTPEEIRKAFNIKNE